MTIASSASPSSEPTSNVRKRRRRNAQACHPCRTRKRKCDTSRPSCEMCLSSDMTCTWPEVDKRRTRSRLTIGATGVDRGKDEIAQEFHDQEEEERDDIEDDAGQDHGFDDDAQSHHYGRDQIHQFSRGDLDRPNQNNWDQIVPVTDTSLTATGHALTLPGFDMLHSISDSPRRISSFTSAVRTSPSPNLQHNLSTYDHNVETQNGNSLPFQVDRSDEAVTYNGMFGMSGFSAQMDQSGSGSVRLAAHE